MGKICREQELVMRKWALAGGLCVLGFACSSRTGDSEPVSVQNAEIVGGVADTGDPAIVEFDASGSNGGDCTADFIATTVLITAAHCVLDSNGRALPASTVYTLYTGDDYNNPDKTKFIPVASVHAHPQYNPNGYDPNVDAHDIAVVLLAHPADVVPLPINVQPLATSINGSAVRIVGYGADVSGSPPAGQDGFGLKRMASTTIDMVNAAEVLVGKTGMNGCDGDSGGAVLLPINGVETVIAIDDYAAGSGPNCTGGDYYQRVDTEMGFISQFLSLPSADAGSSSGDANAGSAVGESADAASNGNASGSVRGNGSASGGADTGAANGSASGSSASGGSSGIGGQSSSGNGNVSSSGSADAIDSGGGQGTASGVDLSAANGPDKGAPSSVGCSVVSRVLARDGSPSQILVGFALGLALLARRSRRRQCNREVAHHDNGASRHWDREDRGWETRWHGSPDSVARIADSQERADRPMRISLGKATCSKLPRISRRCACDCPRACG